jgi:hypothetical protein
MLLYCRMTEESMNPSFAELIRAGEIVSSILPYEYRDFQKGEDCYKRAWEKNPTNSKINHKLGLLYLTTKKVRV